jgi:hypothetical protein
MNKEVMRQIIMEDLEMRMISAKMVPRIVIDDRKCRLPGQEIQYKNLLSALFTWLSLLLCLALSKMLLCLHRAVLGIKLLHLI